MKYFEMAVKELLSGAERVVESVDRESVEEFIKTLVEARKKRRKVLLWDNYPVNDYCRGRLNLGPLRNRRRELPNYLEGVLFNPMNEAYASSIPLATCSDYAWGPDMYDPQCSWRSGLRLLSLIHI